MHSASALDMGQHTLKCSTKHVSLPVVCSEEHIRTDNQHVMSVVLSSSKPCTVITHHQEGWMSAFSITGQTPHTETHNKHVAAQCPPWTEEEKSTHVSIWKKLTFLFKRDEQNTDLTTKSSSTSNMCLQCAASQIESATKCLKLVIQTAHTCQCLA